MKINGNLLPERILQLIDTDKWIEPIDKSNLLNLIIKKSPFNDDESLLRRMVKSFTLYNLELMERESIAFGNWAETGEEIVFHGKNDSKTEPGEINPKKLILFADFGLGEDTPFGLDYQNNELIPKVVLLYYGKNPFKENRWIEIANSFEEFENIIMN